MNNPAHTVTEFYEPLNRKTIPAKAQRFCRDSFFTLFYYYANASITTVNVACLSLIATES